MPESTLPSGGLDDPELASLAEAFIESHRRGEQQSIEELEMKHPHLAGKIRDYFPALLLLERVRSENLATRKPQGQPGDASTLAGGIGLRLGEFQIIREVGRGGMGVVYEAIQEPSARRVALKVLPFIISQDVKRLERFKREAQAVARLQHPNVVPIYQSGKEQGVHYFAMHFVEGPGLHQIIHELRKLRSKITEDGNEGPPEHPSTTSLALALLSGNLEKTSIDADANGIPDECSPLQLPGDANQDGGLDLSDALFLLGHMFLGDPPLLPCGDRTALDPANRSLLDHNGDGSIDLSDPVGVLTYLFLTGGTPPALGVQCVPIAGCPRLCRNG